MMLEVKAFISDTQDGVDEQVKKFVLKTIDMNSGYIDDIKYLDDRFTGGKLTCVIIFDRGIGKGGKYEN
ncbi:MAG: hypothetical protein KH968_05155 [Finegoldia magna]|uniref:hypothetical protein n=1 Tax=Finegoldia magna TaxID=1260 RepID=UPI00242DFCC4|nr:hypothetical protein [Finegoldia magna]MBS5971169.1 hypothetical protein [Finegoldia magna]